MGDPSRARSTRPETPLDLPRSAAVSRAMLPLLAVLFSAPRAAEGFATARTTRWSQAVTGWELAPSVSMSSDSTEDSARARRIAGWCASGPCVSPSVAKANVVDIGGELDAVVAAGAAALHFGPQSPPFVPKRNWIHPDILLAVRDRFPDTVFEVKLSTSLLDPVDCKSLIGQYARAGADAIYIHPESTFQPMAVLNMIKAEGCAAGLVLNPDTAVEGPVAEAVKAGMADVLVFMLVSPGHGKRFDGRNYVDSAERKMREARLLAAAADRHVLLSVDGGVGAKNAARLKAAGADILVAGGALFEGEASDRARVVAELTAPPERA